MSISKTTIENTPVELQNMRISVNQYIKKKIEFKKYSPKFEERVYNHSLKETDLNEIKLFKYQLFKLRYNNNLKFIILNIKNLEDKINKKEITFNDIFKKTSIEIFPEKWKEVRKRKLEEEKFLYETHLKSRWGQEISGILNVLSRKGISKQFPLNDTSIFDSSTKSRKSSRFSP